VTPSDGVPTADTETARQRIDGGDLVLDVRNADEWSAGRIADSVWIPMGQLSERQGELPDDRAIVVVCRSGARSATVTTALTRAGYDATNLAGGLLGWADAGLPLVTDDETPGTVA